MSTPDLVAFLLRQADIASSTDRGDVYREAAGRLKLMSGLLEAAEQARLAIALHAGCPTDGRLLEAMEALDDTVAYVREAEVNAR